MRKYAARVDANHSELIQVWRQLGANVEDMSRVGGGFPDALVTYRGVIYLAEIKDGNKPTTAYQDLFRRRQETHGGRVWIIRSESEALAMLGARVGA